jgi:AcrR family transcriptional regulator
MTDNWHHQIRTKNRDELIAAGKTLFLEHGFLGRHVKEICESAGISRVTFYKHFETLDHLIYAIQVELLETMTEAVAIAATEAGEKNGREQLTDMLHAWMAFARQHPDYIRFILLFDLHYENYPADSVLKSSYTLYIEERKKQHFLLQTLERGIADGTLKADPHPLHTAQFIFTTMMSMLQNSNAHHTACPEEAEVEMSERFLAMLLGHLSTGQ